MASIENIGRQFRGVVTLPIHEVHGFLSGDFHDDVAHENSPITVGVTDAEFMDEQDEAAGHEDRLEQNATIRKSIRAEGVTAPVDAKIDKSNRVFLMDGHHRVAYATEAGITHIPVRFK
jgi:hypothetical protein